MLLSVFLGSSIVQLSVYLFMVSWDYFCLLCGYLKVAVSDRVAIEKLVGFQLAVLMSLDIR